MISYKVLLLIALLVIGGLCSTVAINHFFSEADQKATRHAIYCEHFKYSKTPFPGCENGHVAD